MPFTADAVEHSDVTESNGELVFTAPEDELMALAVADLQKAAQHAAGRPMRVRVVAGNAPAAAPPARPGAAGGTPPDEISGRALADPEVKRFQELFPGSHIRQVRNLKE